MHSSPMKITHDVARATAATALRDLADEIDAGGSAETVVCVVGKGAGAAVYVMGGSVEIALTETAALLEGIVDSLPMANASAH
jgi:hypothetical protein